MKAALGQRRPDLHFTLQIIRTEGDEVTNVPLASFGSRGVFVKEIENALLAGSVDVAVHSLKDLPSETPPGLELAAVSEREDARDVLVTHHRKPLAALPEGALIGTSSPRRAAQIKAFRRDFRTADLRGNLDTRLRKAERGDYDGVVLAAAGIHRLGLAGRIAEYLPVSLCVPAVGQGALAIECRADDRETVDVVAGVEHGPTRRAVTAERAFMRALGGGCQAPAGAFGEEQDGKLNVVGAVVSLDGQRVLRTSVAGPAGDAVALGEALAAALLSQGARAILAEARGLAEP